MGISSSVTESENKHKELEKQVDGNTVEENYRSERRDCEYHLKKTCVRYKEKIIEVERGITTFEEQRVKLYIDHQCQNANKGATTCNSYREVELLLQFLTLTNVKNIKNLIRTEIHKKHIIQYIESLGLTVEEAYRLHKFLKEENMGILDNPGISQIVIKEN